MTDIQDSIEKVNYILSVLKKRGHHNDFRHIQAVLVELDKHREALIKAKGNMIEMANNAVKVLRHHKPGVCWDDGNYTAQYYYKFIDEIITPPKLQEED